MSLTIPKQYEESFVDDLNKILTIQNPYEQDCHIQLFLDQAQNPTNSEVKLRSASGKRFDVQVGTDQGARQLAIMPAGKKMPRLLALNLMREYGPQGQYRGRHRATGLTKFDYATLAENTKQRLKFLYPDLEKELERVDGDYLIHVPQAGNSLTAGLFSTDDSGDSE